MADVLACLKRGWNGSPNGKRKMGGYIVYILVAAKHILINNLYINIINELKARTMPDNEYNNERLFLCVQ